MLNPSKTILARILDKVFPKAPDFFHMLTEQIHASRRAGKVARPRTEVFTKCVGNFFTN